MATPIPLKYNKKVHPQQIIDLMKLGYSQRSFAAEIGVAQQTVSNWVSKYPEFAEAVEIGRTHRERFYDEIGIKMMVGHIKGNHYIWTLRMQNDFGMLNKSQVELTGDLNVTQSIAINFIDDESTDNE